MFRVIWLIWEMLLHLHIFVSSVTGDDDPEIPNQILLSRVFGNGKKKKPNADSSFNAIQSSVH